METDIDWTHEPSNDRERRLRSAYLTIVVEDHTQVCGELPNPRWGYMALCALRNPLDDVASDLAEAIETARLASEEYMANKRRAEHQRFLALARARVGSAG